MAYRKKLGDLTPRVAGLQKLKQKAAIRHLIPHLRCWLRAFQELQKCALELIQGGFVLRPGGGVPRHL